jgi:hypothetical protein
MEKQTRETKDATLAEMVSPLSNLFSLQHESRIKKTESDFDFRFPQAKESIGTEGEEDEDEIVQNIDFNDQPELIYDKHAGIDIQEGEADNDGLSYEDTETEQYNTADYEQLIATTYEKAKKYKRKAKKLYTNLQNVKSQFQEQSEYVKQLEDENQELSSKMLLFSNRVDDLQHAYNKLYEVISYRKFKFSNC